MDSGEIPIELTRLLSYLVEKLNVKNAIVFTRTKHGANKVAADLQKAGITAAAIHGNKSQTARQQALSDFKAGKVKCLVATDIAARGLDIEELSHVFNYNLPEVSETYVHRIGRTGRAGHGGTAVSFCDFGEKPYLKDIEKLIGRKVPLVEDHPWPMEIFEAPKDAKGRPVNADDAEARQAARERRRERAAAREERKPRQSPPVPAPVPPEDAGQSPKKKRRRRKDSGESGAQPVPIQPASPAAGESAKKGRRGVRQQHLEDTMPTALSQPSSDFYKPNPLDGDVILDATARLLAPRKGPAPEHGQGAKRKKHASATQSEHTRREQGRHGQEKREQKAPEKQGEGKKREDHKRERGRSRGRRGGAPEVVLRSGSQKDSTEQPSLIKPYYLTPDD